jgi:glycosyltransferase involved in cell wall biosynthesis
MHVLLIHQAFASLDEPGGTRHIELARHLVGRGHRVTVIGSRVSYLTGEPATRETAATFPGLTVRRVYSLPAWHRSFVLRVVSFFSFMCSSFVAGVSEPQVDLLWATSPPLFQVFTAWILAKMKRIPMIFEVRDLWPYFAEAVGVLRQPVLIWLARGLEGFLYRRSDRIVVNSPGFIEHVRRRGGERISLVPNGVDAEMFSGVDGTPFRRKHDLEGRFIVLYAGAHGLSNDLDVVLQAATRLKDAPTICFVLVGDGKEKRRLIDQARRAELPNVVFLPPVAKMDMPGVLAAADVCLAILKPIEAYKLTYPNKVFDYMAAGRPVILAIDGVIRSVIEEAAAGIFVPPGDPAALAEAVRRIAAEPARLAAMGRAGQAFVVERLNRRDQAQAMEQIMLDLLPGAQTATVNPGA